MTPERYQQIGELYHAALDIDAGERAAFLERECAGDEKLRREVESLIKSHEQSENFIATPALSVAAEMLAAHEADSLKGQMIGRYRVLSQIGSGGMGRVYLADDEALGRHVALKLLPEHITHDKDQMQRFQREARAASALNHPNILTVHEVGQWQGRDFIATEFVRGVTLRTRLRRKLSLAEAVDVAQQIAGALSAAHAAGIVHRDIKPENIMIRPDGLVKILDFGIAKYSGPGRAPDSQSWVKTATGVIVGTTAYMSPEQARGQEVDARTDIWSLGVILYEMIARRLPFPGKTPTDRIAAILEREPAPLSKQRRGIPRKLEEIIERTLAKDKAARYPRVADLAGDLRRLRPTLGDDRYFRFALPTPSPGLFSFSKQRSIALAALLFLMVAVSVTLLVYFRRSADRRESASSNLGAIDSIAVLPFQNLSGDATQEYFVDGMTDALIGDLAKIGALRVISRTSSMHYKGTSKSLPEIARELNIDAVVEGTVQRYGERVHVSAQLIHAASDSHLWAAEYDRDLRDALDLQSEVARAIAAEVRIKVTPAEQKLLVTKRASAREAIDNYLQGRYFLNKRTEQNLHRAIDYFEDAIKSDPNYAQAYAGLADSYNQLGTTMIGELPPLEARRTAEIAARKALEIDDEVAEAHAALGWINYFNWNWAVAEEEFKRSLELNPNYASAHRQYAVYLVAQGRSDEALEEINRAQELDPLSLAINSSKGFILENARRYDEAIEQLRRVVAMDPEQYQAYFFLGLTYAANRQFDEAIAASEKAVAMSGRTPAALGVLGLAYGLAGRKQDANKVLNELLQMQKQRYVTPMALVYVYIGLANKDQAFAWLEKAYQERSNHLAFSKVSPTFDSLRSDPRFTSLSRQIALTPESR